jgi:hypothetical protein
MPEFSGSITLQLRGQTVVAVPDAADHLLTVASVAGNLKTTDALWNGALNANWSTSDTIGGKGKQSGYFRNVHQDGDENHGTFEATLSDGAMTGTGAWRFTGGTGKFSHITGGGVATVKQTSPTESEMEWSGSYNIG